MNVCRSLLSRSALLLVAVAPLAADAAEVAYPPTLPGGKAVATDTSPDFLKPAGSLQKGVEIARTPPTIDFMYYTSQTYPTKTWSVWGDGTVANGKYYSAIGDHDAPAGNAFVYEYDPETQKLRLLTDPASVLNLPEGHYSPSKVHTRVDVGNDGWVYFATHRGSTRVTTDEYHYQGDWVLRHHPEKGETEIVAHAPVPKHCIPTGMLDPERLVYYGGTSSGDNQEPKVMFFAWDIRNDKLLYAGPDGPPRAMILAQSTGRVYWVPSGGDDRLVRFDPAEPGPPVTVPGRIGLRTATTETPDGYVYTAGQGADANLYRFNTKTEEIKVLGPLAVAAQTYTTSIDIDPSGRYLYYLPGAHGGSERDGAPVVQHDLKTGKKKVIAFLHPFYDKKYGWTPLGTFSIALSEQGDKLFITWNGSRGGLNARGKYDWNTCAMTVVHIPESERQP